MFDLKKELLCRVPVRSCCFRSISERMNWAPLSSRLMFGIAADPSSYLSAIFCVSFSWADPVWTI